jgi:hypothetical protein
MSQTTVSGRRPVATALRHTLLQVSVCVASRHQHRISHGEKNVLHAGPTSDDATWSAVGARRTVGAHDAGPYTIGWTITQARTAAPMAKKKRSETEDRPPARRIGTRRGAKERKSGHKRVKGSGRKTDGRSAAPRRDRARGAQRAIIALSKMSGG